MHNSPPQEASAFSMRRLLITYLPFWTFLGFSGFGDTLYFTLLAPLGEKILPLWMVGAIICTASLAQLVLAIPAGYILDRFGYRKVLIMATAVFLCALLILCNGLTIMTYCLSIVAAMVWWLFASPGSTAYLLLHTRRSSVGRFMAFGSMCTATGSALASVSIGVILLLDIYLITYILIIPLVIALMALCASPSTSPSSTKKNSTPQIMQAMHISLKAFWRLNPASSILCLLGFSSSLLYGVIWFVAPLVIAHSFNSSMLSAGLGMFDCATIVLGFVCGSLADTRSKSKLVFAGLCIFAVSSMLLSYSFGWSFALCAFFAAVGDEMATISLWAWLHNIEDEHSHDGSIAAIINVAYDLGWAIGPLWAGILYPIIGASLTIFSSALLILVICILYQIILVRYPRDKKISN